MSSTLRIAAAQLSHPGPKPENEDALGLHMPAESGQGSQALAAAIADGLSSAEGGRIAAETSVQNFLSDLFATPASWSVKTAGTKVLEALNRWLYGQGQHYHHGHRGFLTTFTALVIKGQTLHVFHIGDSRLWRLRGDDWDCLTKDHALTTRTGNQLTRALGMDWRADVDYRELDVQTGDIYLLSTDGIHQFVSDKELKAIVGLREHTVDARCEELHACAMANHSDDNRSCQIIEILGLPSAEAPPAGKRDFPPPLPELQPGQSVDGYVIDRELHANARSRVYLTRPDRQGQRFILKTPDPLADIPDLQALQREDWIGQRLQHPDLVRTIAPDRPRRFLYLVQEYVDGVSLRQWRAQHPEAGVEQVMAFAAPAVRALRALHRRETLHQDVKPDNFLVTREGKLKLIDFGSASVGSLTDLPNSRPGAAEYAAPEYALGIARDHRADQFALAVTFYELLTGHYPFGEQYKEAKTPGDFRKLRYVPATRHTPHVPLWLDAALAKALSLNPEHRYTELSEFLHDLEQPNIHLALKTKPWLEQNPLLFWQLTSALLFGLNLVLLALWLK